MARFLLLGIIACALWLVASTVMFGLFLFIPLAVLIWGWFTPVEPEPVETLNDEFWSLIRWNAER